MKAMQRIKKEAILIKNQLPGASDKWKISMLFEILLFDKYLNFIL